MKKLLSMLLLAIFAMGAAGENRLKEANAKISEGKLLEYDNFPTKMITPRNVYVWTPSDYTEGKRYDVVYMHDGQMLFDSTTTWNHQEWKADENVGRMLKDGKINDCIIVGIWNIPENRFYDYFPQKTLRYMQTEVMEKAGKGFDLKRFDADNYLKFIVTELKPYIDGHFRTNAGKEHTFLMGSSMGGLISLYGLCEYPETFGGAACMSMHSVMISPEASNAENAEATCAGFCKYLKENLPKANSAKIYIDFGSKTLDAFYVKSQGQIDDVLREAGWTRPYWTTNYYPGMAHSEKDWAERLPIPFQFLIGK
ncbi:MAG: esterase family protein [Muribaculaceae bacterium]|jgi:predicted alpha/beta superfamily hydrolase|nr:esterase family protein [Muribaculaceae bacterium]